jgi:hypothetical protein
MRKLAVILFASSTVDGATAWEYCDTKPWVDLLSQIPDIAESVLSFSQQVPRSKDFDEELESFDYRGTLERMNAANDMSILESFDAHVKQALSFQKDRSDKIELVCRYSDWRSIRKVPRVLILKVDEFKQDRLVWFADEFRLRGKNMKLIGTIQQDDQGEWAHIQRNDDGAGVLRIHDKSDVMDINQTRYVVFAQSGDSPCSVQPWFDVLNSLRSGVVRPEDGEFGVDLVGIGWCAYAILEDFRKLNPIESLALTLPNRSFDSEASWLPRRTAFYAHSLGSLESVSKAILGIGREDRFPSIFVLQTKDPAENAEAQFPLIFHAFKKCMHMRGTIQADERNSWSRVIASDTSWTEPRNGITHPRGSEYPVDASTLFAIYEHHSACDLDDADQLASLAEAKQQLITIIGSEMDEISKVVEAVSFGVPGNTDEIRLSISKDIFADVTVTRNFFLRELDSDPTLQIAKIREVIGTLEYYTQAAARIQLYAQLNRVSDSNAPMTFVNIDGSCFANAPVQVLLNLPGIEGYVAAMHPGPLQEALADLIDRKTRGEAISFPTKLRYALGEEATMCAGAWGEKTMLEMLAKIPQLGGVSLAVDYDEVVTRTAELADRIKKSLPRFIFVDTHFSIARALGRLSYFNFPTMTTRSGEYELIASLENQPGHVFANVRVTLRDGTDQWYALNNSTAEKRNFADVGSQEGSKDGNLVNKETAMLVYKLKPVRLLLTE